MTVRDKREGFDETREQFAHATDEFRRYAEQFGDGVRSKRQLAVAFREEVAATRAAFEETTDAFDAYAAAFETDVAARRDAVAAFREEVAATRAAFEEAIEAFERYAEEFDDGVDAQRQRVAAFREEVTETVDAFDAYADRFGDEVDAQRRDVEAFLEAIDETSTAFERARADLTRAVSEFYGYDLEVAADPAVDADGDGSPDGAAPDAASSDTTGGVDDAPDPTERTVPSEPSDPTRPGSDPGGWDEGETGGGVATVVGADAIDDEHEQGNGDTAESDTIGTESADREDTPETEVADDAASETPEDMVECLVCGEFYQAITESHLQTHDMSMEEYKEEFGEDVSLYPGEE